MTGEGTSAKRRRRAAALVAAVAVGTGVLLVSCRQGGQRDNGRPGRDASGREAHDAPSEPEPRVAGAAPAAEPAPALPSGRGLTVSKDGKLLKGGREYRAIGVNYCDLFQTLIRDGDDERTLEGLRFLSEKKIPFVRFWGCGFWPKDWDLYFEDKAEWFRRLDLVVRTAEKHNVGLIPSLFWRTRTYPDLVDEYNDQWGNPESRTREFMRTYVREVVTRYRDSPAIWGWEFANEMNLSCNLPNGMNFLGQSLPHLKVNVEKHERNLMTYEIAAAAWSAFALEVRKHDRFRFVTTGNSCPRICAYHNATEKSWKHDGPAEAFEAFGWMSPDPTDVVSVHFYARKNTEHRYADSVGVRAVLARYKESARKLAKPLFLGEFAASGKKGGAPITAEELRKLLTTVLDAVVEEEIDLAAYWVFDRGVKRNGVGLVRKGNDREYILDLIAECNEKTRAKLAGEKQPRTNADERR